MINLNLNTMVGFDNKMTLQTKFINIPVKLNLSSQTSQNTVCPKQTWKKFQSFRKHVLSTTDISAYAFLKIIVEMKSSFIGYKYNKYLIFK